MESIFVLCFQKDRGLRLSPKHPEARRHTGLRKLLALNEGSRPRRDAGPVSAVCIRNGWNGTCTHSQHVSPGKGNSTTACSWAQPASHGCGKKSIQVRGGAQGRQFWELHGSSELEDGPRTKSSDMETLFFWDRPKMSVPPKLQAEASPTNLSFVSFQLRSDYIYLCVLTLLTNPSSPEEPRRESRGAQPAALGVSVSRPREGTTSTLWRPCLSFTDLNLSQILDTRLQKTCKCAFLYNLYSRWSLHIKFLNRGGKSQLSYSPMRHKNYRLQLFSTSPGLRILWGVGRAGASNVTGLQFRRAEVTGAQSRSFQAGQRTKFSILHSVYGRSKIFSLLPDHLCIPALSTVPICAMHHH